MAQPLTEKITALLGSNPTVAAGKLQMIGLSRIREKLGDRWEKSRSHISITVERAITNELGDGDVYFQIDELAYVVLFKDRDINESSLICAKIAQGVCRKLFGEDEDIVRVRTVTCNADGSILSEDVNVEATLDTMLEAKGVETIFDRDGEVAETADSSPKQDKRRSIRLIDPLGAAVVADLSDVEFKYSPVWDTFRRVVVTYLCRPHLRAAEPSGSQFPVAEETEEQVEIDLRILEDCAQKVRELRSQNRRVLIVFPVHWSTIARSKAWIPFKAALNSLHSEVSQDLIACVHGLDSGLPNIRIAQEFPKLSQYSRAIYACIGCGDVGVERFVNTKTACVGFSIPNGTIDERSIVSRAREFCIAADAKNIPSFAFGLSTRSLVIALLGTGFRYLEGAAIRPAVATPRHAFAQEMVDLFKDEFNSDQLPADAPIALRTRSSSGPS
ncbi:MAG: hypothetical protein WAW96_11755 [Alphaproteobacteria bacterium]